MRPSEERASQQDFFGQTIAGHPEDLILYIGLEAIEGQDDVPLFLEPRFEAFGIDQRFVAVHEMGLAAFRNADLACLERLMHFRDAAMFMKTPLANQGNAVQARLTVRECPASLFFWAVAVGAI